MSRKQGQLLFEVICSKLSDCPEEILEPLLELAIEIAREGREGRRIGTLFTIGDAEAVMAWSRPLILNPFEGHPRNYRHIGSAELWGTVKELAQLDGALSCLTTEFFSLRDDTWTPMLRMLKCRSDSAVVISRQPRSYLLQTP